MGVAAHQHRHVAWRNIAMLFQQADHGGGETLCHVMQMWRSRPINLFAVGWHGEVQDIQRFQCHAMGVTEGLFFALAVD